MNSLKKEEPLIFMTLSLVSKKKKDAKEKKNLSKN